MRCVRVLLPWAVLCLLAGPVSLLAEEHADPAGAMKAYVHYLLEVDPVLQASNLDQAVRKDPESAFLQVEKAHLAWNLERDVDKAIALAEKAVELDPESVAAHTLLARVHTRLAELGGKRQAYHLDRGIHHMEALGSLPEAHLDQDSDHWLMLANLYELRARLRPEDLVANLDKALEALRQGAVGEQGQVKSVYLLIELGRREEAMAVLEEQLRKTPEWLDGHRFYGELLAEASEWEKAAEQNRIVLASDPADHRIRIQLGRNLEKLDRLDEALSAYDAVLESGPTEEAARLALYLSADLEERRARFDSAARRFRRLVEAFPESTELRFELAQFLQARGRKEESSKELQKILEIADRSDPKWLRLAVSCADLLSALGEYSKSTPLLEELLEQQPDSPEVALTLIETYQAVGDHKKAQRLATRKRKQLKEPGTFWLLEGQAALLGGEVLEGKRILDAFLNEGAGSYRDHGMVAAALSAAGLPEESIPYLERAVELAEAAGESGDASRFRLQKALALVQAGRRTDAANQIAQMAEADPSSIELAFAWARQILIPEERFEDLLRLTRTKQEEHPGIRAFYLWEIDALIELGRLEEAGEAAKKAAERFASNMNFASLRIEILARQELRGEAMKEARKMLRDPGADLSLLLLLADRLRSGGALEEARLLLAEESEPYHGSAQLAFTQGVILERLDKLEESYAHLQRAIELDPSFHSAMNYLGYTLVENGGDLKEARTWIERALLLDPNNPAYLDSLGWAMLLMGRSDAAAPHLEKSARMVPEDPVVRMHLARLREEQGRHEEALEEYRKALSEGLDERVEETRRRIRALGGDPTLIRE